MTCPFCGGWQFWTVAEDGRVVKKCMACKEIDAKREWEE